MFYVHIMATTTTGCANGELMFELAKLLEKHGSKSVIEALADACDAAGDHAGDMLEGEEGAKAHGAFYKASKALYGAAEQVARAEKVAGNITLDSAAIVLSEV